MGALMGRKIFGDAVEQPSALQQDPSPAPSKRSFGGSVGGLRESLREITANSIRDIDPALIEQDGLRDRLNIDGPEIDELAESIRAHGQQVPILVRQSSTPDRYKIVYGRRRLAAIRKLGIPAKAIVRTLDDEASVIAQGQENNLRLDPSFIEKAIFIRELQVAGYPAQVIQDALGLSRQGVSNHKVVLDALPAEIVPVIGPAHGIGRRQWSDLAKACAPLGESSVEIAEAAVVDLPTGTDGSKRFQVVLNACLAHSAPSLPAADVHRGGHLEVRAEDGSTLATMKSTNDRLNLQFDRKAHPEFGLWLEARADDIVRSLLDRWHEETGRKQ